MTVGLRFTASSNIAYDGNYTSDIGVMQYLFMPLSLRWVTSDMMVATVTGRVAVATLGQTLKARRIERGLTQEQLEERSGVSQTHISQIESGKTRQPTDATLYALADALGFELAELQQLAGTLTVRTNDPARLFWASYDGEISPEDRATLEALREKYSKKRK